MAGDMGAVGEAINASKVHLELVSAGQNRLILLQEIETNISHPEAREATDAGSVYFYGQSDDYFDATMLLSTPEIGTFIGYTELTSDGDLPSNDFDIIYSDKTGTATRRLNVTCQIPNLTFSKPVEGGVKTRLRFRITGGAVSGGTYIKESSPDTDITTS
jgi:hypothetical protein